MVVDKERTLKLHLKNFQAFDDLDVEFVQGVNTIIGESNSGKTSVLRAIKSLIENGSRTARYIKQDTNETEVNMQYEGHDITWSRTVKEIKYKIDGQDFLKAGTTDLFKLQPVNGFVRDPQGELANLEDEWTLPYPYYKTPSELFKVFENIFCVSDSAKVLKGMKESEDEYKRTLQRTEDEITKVEKKLEAIEKLNVRENVEKLTELKETLQGLERERDELKEAIEKLQEIAKKVKLYRNLPKETINLQEKWHTLEDVSEDVRKLHDLSQAYETLNGLQDITVTSQEVLEEVTRVQELRTDLKKLHELKRVQYIIFPDKVEHASDEKLQEIRELSQDLRKLQELLREGKELKGRLTQVNEEIVDLQEEVSKIDICPLCGQEMKNCKELTKC